MDMQRDVFRCIHRLRVRWAEVDVQKIVFNAHYLAYADCAVMAYWRALALPYEATVRALGGNIYLKKASVEYHASARLDDLVDMGIRCARIGASSIVFESVAFVGDRALASVELIYVFADPVAQTKRAVPPSLRAVIEHYEAGGQMVELRVGDWAALGCDALALRTEVFVHEQGIAAELELDEHDAGAIHAVAYNRLGHPIATGRLLQPVSGTGRIGRMAVDRVVRGQRWGRLLLDRLIAAARARGDSLITLHAQRSAEDFYRRVGFQTVGEPFDDAGIAHIPMRLTLA
jgi:YbgC/YbaW family acyl-CoA thioester hydrolase